MEGMPKLSHKLGYPDENDDVKYVSKLSTILVATIQEAKDRISQIEYIFCTQLYSNFQAKSKSLQKICMEMKKEAEESWKEKEKHLLLQIEKLELQYQEALEESRCLRLEKEKALMDLDEKIKPLLLKEINQQERIDKLEAEIRNKSKEVDEGLELHSKLLHLVQSNSFTIVDETKQLQEYEEKTNKMLAQVKKSEQKIAELGEEVRKKSEELADKEELTQDLYKRVESLTSALTKSGRSVTYHEKEKKELLGKLEDMEYKVCGLQKKLRKKTEEQKRSMWCMPNCFKGLM